MKISTKFTTKQQVRRQKLLWCRASHVKWFTTVLAFAMNSLRGYWKHFCSRLRLFAYWHLWTTTTIVFWQLYSSTSTNNASTLGRRRRVDLNGVAYIVSIPHLCALETFLLTNYLNHKATHCASVLTSRDSGPWPSESPNPAGSNEKLALRISASLVEDDIVVVGIRLLSVEQLAALLWLSVEQPLRTVPLVVPPVEDGYDRPPVDGVRGFDPGVPGVGRSAVGSLDGGLADSADAGCWPTSIGVLACVVCPSAGVSG